MKEVLIKAFGVCTTESMKVINVKEFLMKALQKGFIVNPLIANADVQAFIESETVDYNSTFYKNWEQMSSRTRLEQLIDQIIHYASTYGTNFEGDTWTLNDNDRSDVPQFNTYKVIDVATPEEVALRCFNLIASGIALSQEMVDAIVDYLKSHGLPVGCTIDQIQNREVMVMLCDVLGVRPTTGVELVRWMVYKATGRTLLIKDSHTILVIKGNASSVDFGCFTEKDLIELSKVFFRFKPIFLAFRENDKNKKVINKIRRMAEKNHVPMREGFWQTVLGEQKDLNEVYNRVGELNSFKIVSLLQTIRERFLLIKDGGKNAYFIRNGKAWVDETGSAVNFNANYLHGVYGVLYSELIKRLSKKAGVAGVVRFPTSIDLACPVSEKKFAGALPYGSAYKLSNHNYFGIYWREEDGTRDFDLSFLNANGMKIGWNSYFRDSNDILFSGDMTHADPDATELIYFKGGLKQEGTLWNNRFYGEKGSKFRYFIGRQEIDNLKKNYVVDPNTVEFEEWTISENTQEMLGVVMDNKIYPCKFGFGQSRVSELGEADKFEMMKRKLNSVISLKQVLLDAGFVEWTDAMTTVVNWETGESIPRVPDYDFTNLDKDTLIKLFTEE